MTLFSKHIRLTLLSILAFNIGCSETASTDEVCGGHGEMHDSHCHCDAGYALSSDGSSCEEAQTLETEGGIQFDPQEVKASVTTENNAHIWVLQAIDNDLHLKIEIYESFGGISQPGSITIDDNEANYATCGTCVLLQTGCVLHGDHYDCSRTFMAKTGGEVKMTQIGTGEGDDFIGEIVGIEFQEVTIAQDYQTQPVTDGETILLNAWSFETQLEAR